MAHENITIHMGKWYISTLLTYALEEARKPTSAVVGVRQAVMASQSGDFWTAFEALVGVSRSDT